MIDHTGIGVEDVPRSAAFYDAALGALGMRRVIELREGERLDGVGYDAAFVRDPDGNNMEAVYRERQVQP